MVGLVVGYRRQLRRVRHLLVVTTVITIAPSAALLRRRCRGEFRCRRPWALANLGVASNDGDPTPPTAKPLSPGLGEPEAQDGALGPLVASREVACNFTVVPGPAGSGGRQLELDGLRQNWCPAGPWSRPASRWCRCSGSLTDQ